MAFCDHKLKVSSLKQKDFVYERHCFPTFSVSKFILLTNGFSVCKGFQFFVLQALSQHVCDACEQLLPELKDIPSSSTTN